MSRSRNKSAKRIALCAVLTALCSVILSLGTVLESLDLSFAAICAFIIWFALLEFGYSTAWGIFFPTSVISLLLLPSKLPALFFIAITGWYPMFKLWVSKRIKKKGLLLFIKLLTFNIVAALLIAGIYFFGALLGINLSESLTKYYIITMLIACNVAFIVTDILMDKLVILYIYKLREKLIKMKIIDKQN